MTDSIIFADRVKKCIKAVRTVSVEIEPETLFKENLGFESIDVVDLLFELDQEFKKSFSLRQLNEFVLANNQRRSWDFSFDLLCKFVSKYDQT